MHIYPSILEKSVATLFRYLLDTEDLFTHYQIDIADGKYVDNTTLTTRDILDHLHDNPTLVPTATCEFHLMVENFAQLIPELQEIHTSLPITQILVHLEPAIRWAHAQDQDADLHEALHDAFPFTFGVALNPEIDVLHHFSTIRHFPTVQIMTIHPGKQGRAFLPETLDKITQLRTHGYSGQIILDGAMNADTLPQVLKNKDWPDAICPGSYLKVNTEKRLEKLYQLVSEA